MTQSEKRRHLIEELLKEDSGYSEISIPADEKAQQDLLRALMNVRPPKPVSDEFLKIQDEYLSSERDSLEITDCMKLRPLKCDERLVLWQGDITTLKTDAIVNAANSGMRGCFYPLHSCIDNIIHTKSGIQLRLYCDEIMKRQGYEEPAGRAKITPAFNLPCRYILHTVGPYIAGKPTDNDCELLAGCYRSCLELAAENDCHSIAFCCISTGEFHFPNDKAAEIAVAAVNKFLKQDTCVNRVIFNVYKDKDLYIYRSLLGEDKC